MASQAPTQAQRAFSAGLEPKSRRHQNDVWRPPGRIVSCVYFQLPPQAVHGGSP